MKQTLPTTPLERNSGWRSLWALKSQSSCPIWSLFMCFSLCPRVDMSKARAMKDPTRVSIWRLAASGLVSEWHYGCLQKLWLSSTAEWWEKRKGGCVGRSGLETGLLYRVGGLGCGWWGCSPDSLQAVSTGCQCEYNDGGVGPTSATNRKCEKMSTCPACPFVCWHVHNFVRAPGWPCTTFLVPVTFWRLWIDSRVSPCQHKNQCLQRSSGGVSWRHQVMIGSWVAPEATGGCWMMHWHSAHELWHSTKLLLGSGT